MNEKKVKVLNAQITHDEVLHETVQLLDDRFSDYKLLGAELPSDVSHYYHEVQRVSRKVLETENRIVAMALAKTTPTVMLIELDMKYDPSEVYGATQFETNDETGAMEFVYLEQV